jgi:MFS family permease
VPLVLLLILLSALPDAMLAVVLRDLFVERYGVPAESAQMFLAVNLLGAGLAVPLVRWLRKSCPAWSIVVSGALADAALLGLMWLPIGFAPTLVLRVLEGVADVATFAALFQILGQVHDRPAAWRMGVGASMLVGGLGAGAAIGGAMIRLSSMGPTIAFVLGAGSCLATALGAWIGAAVLERSAPSAERPECGPPARSGSLWPVLLMAASDRATGAALTAVFAGFLARNLGYDPAQRGLLVGLPLILMAVGAAPAGWVADRLGALRVRTACAVAYALGVAAAPLLPASLSLASRAGRGTSGLAAFRAAGDGGYFLGILAVVTVGALAGGDRMGTQQALMAGFGLLHLACTAGTVMAMRRER